MNKQLVLMKILLEDLSDVPTSKHHPRLQTVLTELQKVLILMEEEDRAAQLQLNLNI